MVCKLMSCAFQLLSDESAGLLTLLEHIRNSPPHQGSEEAMVRLLNVLFEFRDIREELISLDIRDILTKKSAVSSCHSIRELVDWLGQQ